MRMTSRAEKAGAHSRGPHRRSSSSPSRRVALVANAEIGAIRDSLHTLSIRYSGILVGCASVAVPLPEASKLARRTLSRWLRSRSLGARVAHLPADIKRPKPNKTDYLSPRPHLSSKGQALLLTLSLIFNPPLFVRLPTAAVLLDPRYVLAPLSRVLIQPPARLQVFF